MSQARLGFVRSQSRFFELRNLNDDGDDNDDGAPKKQGLCVGEIDPRT